MSRNYQRQRIVLLDDCRGFSRVSDGIEPTTTGTTSEFKTFVIRYFHRENRALRRFNLCHRTFLSRFYKRFYRHSVHTENYRSLKAPTSFILADASKLASLSVLLWSQARKTGEQL